MAVYITIWELFGQSGLRVAGWAAENSGGLFGQAGPRVAGSTVADGS